MENHMIIPECWPESKQEVIRKECYFCGETFPEEDLNEIEIAGFVETICDCCKNETESVSICKCCKSVVQVKKGGYYICKECGNFVELK